MSSQSRKERERQQHRNEVLRAAEAVLVERGFDGTTMQEIAERAEFSVGSLYNLFDSKESILGSLSRARFSEFIRHIENAMGRASRPNEKVRAAIKAKVQFCQERRSFVRVLSEMHSKLECDPASNGRTSIQKMYESYIRKLEAVLRSGIASGVFRPGEAKIMALAVDGATNALMHHWMLTGTEIGDSATADQIEEMLFHGLLREAQDR